MVKPANTKAPLCTASRLGLTPIPAQSAEIFTNRLRVYQDFEHKEKAAQKPAKKKQLVKGKLIDLKRKIRYKNLSYQIIKNLIHANPGSDLLKSYHSSLKNCQSEFIQEGKTLRAKYCNNRFCYSCNRIRTGKMMNNYLPVIELMGEGLQMLTLTVPNVVGIELRNTIKQMNKTFVKIKDTLRKKGVKVVGIKKLEVTYNQKRKDFHPHFHFLIDSHSTALQIRELWLKHYTSANELAQDIRPADMASAKELFKYFTKFWGTGKHSKGKTNYRALDIIFTAMYGLRVFQPYGLKDLKISIDESEEIDTLQSFEYNIEAVEGCLSWYYEPNFFNFINPDTGEMLLEVSPTKKQKAFYLEILHPDGEPPPEYWLINKPLN